MLEAGAEAAAEDAVLLAAVLLLQAVMPRAAAPSALTAVPLRKDLRDSFDMVVSPYIFFFFLSSCIATERLFVKKETFTSFLF